MDKMMLDDQDLEQVSGGLNEHDEQMLRGDVPPGSSAIVLFDEADTTISANSKNPKSAQRSENCSNFLT